MAEDDAVLLGRAAHGDSQSFHELMGRHGASLYRLACALVGNRTDAEDVLQEALVGAFRSLDRFEGRASVRTWLGQILVRQAALWRRTRKRRSVVVLPPDESLPAAPEGGGASDFDGRHDVALALSRLSEEHRAVIVLREYEQMSYDEIAAALEIPRGTVESRLHRARSELRTLLGDYRP